MKYLTPKEACKHYKVSIGTLRIWDSEKKIESVRTKGGHRRYIVEEDETKGRRICYCRVSTKEQKKDLERQVEFFRINYPDHEIIKDIGSGINFNRKGFQAILDSAIKGNVSEVVVTHKDRFVRFGFKFFEGIIDRYSSGKIVVLDDKTSSPEEELVHDLLSIITVFSSRLYGLRSHETKRKIEKIVRENIEDKNLSNKGGGDDVNGDV